MHFDQIKIILPQIKSLGLNSFVLTGGEVFLHPQIIDLLNLCHDLGISPKIVTNGLSFNERHAECIKNTTNKISISLDGDRQFHNYFRQNLHAFSGVVRAINLCNDHGIDTAIIASIYRENYALIECIIDFCLEKRIRNLRFQPVRPQGRGKQLRKSSKLLDQIELAGLYSKVINYSLLYAGYLKIKAVGISRKEIDCHGCSFGLHFGPTCHRKNPPWPLVFAISCDGKIFPFDISVPSHYSLGVIKNNLRDKLDQYYGSAEHIQVLQFLRNIYISKIFNSDDNYVDISSLLLEELQLRQENSKMYKVEVN